MGAPAQGEENGRTSRKASKAMGHGARVQVPVSKHAESGCRDTGSEPRSKWSEPTRACGTVATERHHSALSTSAIPHVGMGPDFDPRAVPEKNKVPNPPTHGTATVMSRRAPIQARNATILGKEARKAMVMEHGIKSPSLRNGCQACRDTGPNASPLRADTTGVRRQSE